MKQNPKSPKKLNLLLFIGIFIVFISCSNDRSLIYDGETPEVKLSASTTDTIVYALVDNVKVPVYLSIPKECAVNGPFPAVVVMHGSYGLWYQNSPESQTMSGQFKEWQNILAENCIVGAFVDSYTERGVITRTGKWAELPNNIKISAQFVRPRDANATLALLQNLKYEDGTTVVQSEDIALLGFSDGATAVASTLIDTDKVPTDFVWTQSDNGTVYDASDGILPPQSKPDVGFSGGVFYYGGSVGYNYWGKHPCGLEVLEENVFYPYAPMLYHIPGDDKLTDNTFCMLDVLEAKGAPVETFYYENAAHSFDYDHIPDSELARARTIAWLKEIWNTN
ncbi:dienelactone hydrolase family protein [Flagellimonas iocasae]|uniref:Dienelactone hydrolase family protein n=1 Tax=Flagellimonas iocasae TaxID=2055905 RepID=A0ABW4XYL7_9FLAO